MGGFGLRVVGAALALGFLVPAAPASAALLHQYSFNNTTSDSVGGMNATLNGGASVSGGSLALNGTSAYAELSGYAIPTNNFSITFDATIAAYSGGTVEMISQGSSGAPGFYIGLSNGVFRFGDSLAGSSVATPSLNVSHAYELISSSAGTQFFIDGTQVFTSPIQATAPQSGTNTRVGAQFQTYGEDFDGTISNLSIYSGTPTVPEPASWALLGVGLLALPVLRRRRG